MRTLITLLCISLFSGMSFGQQSIFSLSDQPGHTLAANVAPKGVFMVQATTGFGATNITWESLNYRQKWDDESYFARSTVRMGLSQGLEAYMNIQAALLYSDYSFEGKNFKTIIAPDYNGPDHFQNIEIGLRKQLKSSDNLNLSGLLAYGPVNRYFRLGLMFSNQIDQHLISLNLHAFTNIDFDWAPAYSLRYAYLFNTFGLYGELWGGPTSYFSEYSALAAGSGVFFQLSPKFMIDLGGNFGLVEDLSGIEDRVEDHWSAEIGITYLLGQP